MPRYSPEQKANLNAGKAGQTLRCPACSARFQKRTDLQRHIVGKHTHRPKTYPVRNPKTGEMTEVTVPED